MSSGLLEVCPNPERVSRRIKNTGLTHAPGTIFDLPRRISRLRIARVPTTDIRDTEAHNPLRRGVGSGEVEDFMAVADHECLIGREPVDGEAEVAIYRHSSFHVQGRQDGS